MKYHVISVFLVLIIKIQVLAIEPSHILFVGDSHSYGEFGKAIDTYLRKLAQEVTSIASCGSSPSTWTSKGSQFKETNCGYWKKNSSNQEVRVKSHTLSSFSEEIKKTSPDLTIIALGTNMLSSESGILSEIKEVEKMLQQVKEARSTCIWIGPPDLKKDPFKKNLNLGITKLKELLEKNNCSFIDSSKLTTYPSGNSDGIHYGAQDSKKWGDKVVEAIDQTIKEKKLLGPPTVLPGSNTSPSSAKVRQ